MFAFISLAVRFGDRDLDFAGDDAQVIQRKITNFMFHPKYFQTPGQGYYDVAIVELDREVQFTDFVKPICLPKIAQANPDVHVEKFITLTGLDRKGVKYL